MLKSLQVVIIWDALYHVFERQTVLTQLITLLWIMCCWTGIFLALKLDLRFSRNFLCTNSQKHFYRIINQANKVLSSISDKTFCKKQENQAKLDKIKKLCCLFLRKFWQLLPKNSFSRGDWTLQCISNQFWDFLFIS